MLYDPRVTSRARLRQTMLQVLPCDSELEAFCLDYFPSVQQRFSLGMDRQAKLNLVLRYVPCDALLAALARFSPAAFSREHDDVLGEGSILPSSRPTTTDPSTPALRKWAHPVFYQFSLWVPLGIILALCGILAFIRIGRIPSSSVKTDAPATKTDAPTATTHSAISPAIPDPKDSLAASPQTLQLRTQPESYSSTKPIVARPSPSLPDRRSEPTERKEKSRVIPSPHTYYPPPMEK